MTFNSYTFLFFFAIVLTVYHGNISWRSKKIFLILASYVFYAAWNPLFILLLMLSTVVDWQLAQHIHHATSVRLRRLYLTSSLLVNLGLLSFFKYSNFLLQSFTEMARYVGVVYQAPELDIILPVGISFYTFQTLSYSLDVYRRRLDPWHSFIDYALFVTFFPQLVAGPIVRARDFLHQTVEPKLLSAKHLGWGLSMMILGLFQKVVIADSLLAPIVEVVYESTDKIYPMDAIISTLAFAGQIFCDFAGYSTIAIGAAMCLGFALPDNFRFPYAAIGFSDFWRRWHISLSSWLHDYLYVSLGGNRNGAIKTYRNLAITMLLGGLWHGASLTFVVWGGLHGLYLVLERIAKAMVGDWSVWKTLPGRMFLGVLTFAMVCLAWVFFRAHTFNKATEIVHTMLTLLPLKMVHVSSAQAITVITVMSVLLSAHLFLRSTTIEDATSNVPHLIRGAILGIMLTLVCLSPGEDRAFLYFQF